MSHTVSGVVCNGMMLKTIISALHILFLGGSCRNVGEWRVVSDNTSVWDNTGGDEELLNWATGLMIHSSECGKSCTY